MHRAIRRNLVTGLKWTRGESRLFCNCSVASQKSETPSSIPKQDVVLAREQKVWKATFEGHLETKTHKEKSYDDMLFQVAGYKETANNSELQDVPPTSAHGVEIKTGLSTLEAESGEDLILKVFSTGSKPEKSGKSNVEKYDIPLAKYLQNDNETYSAGRFERAKSRERDLSSSSLFEDVQRTGELGDGLDLRMTQHKQNIIKKKEQEEAMKKKLLPILENIDKTIENDNDLLTVISKYIVLLRKSLNAKVNGGKQARLSEKPVVETTDPLSNELTIPEPLQETIPFIIKQLLVSDKYDFVGEDRKYIILSWVHNVCKNYHKDINLYLSVFTIDLYNYLLQLSWSQYKDISSISVIVTEMKNNGVTGDINTINILEEIDRDIEKNQILTRRARNGDSSSSRGIPLLRSHGHLQVRSKLQHYLKMLKNMVY